MRTLAAAALLLAPPAAWSQTTSAPLRAGVPVAPPRPPAATRPAPPRPPAPPAGPSAPASSSEEESQAAPAAAPAPSGPPAAPEEPQAERAGASLAGQAAGPARTDGKCQPLQGRFLLAFNRADIVDVLEQASRWTCRNFIYTDDIARGKITLLSKTPVTADEAYAAFLASLSANGIAIYQTGRYYKLVRVADAKKTPIPTLLEEGEEAPAIEQPVTKVIRLKYSDPDQLRGILGNFTSPQGADIQAIQPDVLILTDIALNVRRIERILDAIDRPGGGDLIRVVPIRYASARELAEKINQIFAAPPTVQRGVPRRPLIGGVAAPPGTAAPAVPEPAEISISKVLADERTNKLIVVAEEKSFQRMLELVKQLDVPAAGEGGIHVVFLKNANAEDLAQTLSALAQGQATARRTGAPAAPPAPGVPTPVVARGATSAELFSGEVKITADKPSNSLVVMASSSDFAIVQRLIDKLDRPRRQVFIEAVIMEVNLSNETQFGVSMHTAVPVKTDQGTGIIPLGSQTGRIGTLNALSPTGLASFVSLGGFLTGLAVPTSADLQDVLPGVPSFAVLIQALQTSSDVNVLSTPHILASDNEESEIVVGQNVPFQAGYNPGFSAFPSGTTTTGGTTPSLGGFGSLALTSFIAPIQRQNVDLKLKVKPQISEGDMVRLDLEEQTEEIVSKDPQLGPTTAKRSVKTKIVAKDQHTIVIGGLIQDRTIQAVRKVPVLGDIPVLGWLFRDTVTTKTKTNLLLFLTPYIIRDASDYRRILDRKRREQREFVEQYLGRQVAEYDVTIDFARKSGPYAAMRRAIDEETTRAESERVVGPDADKARPAPPRP